MSFDLRTLRSFVTVASAGSISAAAEILHIAQPALSVQIKQLEEQLGTPLFERHPRGVTLTSAGDRLLVHVIEILKRIDVAYEDVRNAIDEPSGRVAIALPQSVAKFVAVPLVQQTLEKWPKIHLQLVEMSTGYIPDQLLRGHIDIGITFGAEDDARIRFTHLLDEELVLVTSERQASILGNVYTEGASVALHTIASLPMVLPTTAHSLRRRIDGYLDKAQASLNVVAEVNAIPELIALATAGVGSTILSYAAVNEDVAAGRLMALRIGSPRMTRSIYSCRSGTLPISIAAARIHEQLHKTIEALTDGGTWPHSFPGNDAAWAETRRRR